jgi:hypothetical protein
VARLGRQRPLQAIFVRTAQQVVIRAQTGPSAAGVAAQATAVKVAKVSGTCAAGLAASSTAKKVASTTGAAAAGAVSQAVVTSVVIQYLVEPFLFAKAASDRAVQAYRYQPPFSYLDFGAPALVFAEAQDGTAPAGASAHGTAKKVAAVTGRSTVGAAATSTIRKVAVATAAAAAGTAVTAVAAKSAFQRCRQERDARRPRRVRHPDHARRYLDADRPGHRHERDRHRGHRRQPRLRPAGRHVGRRVPARSRTPAR